MMEDIPHLNDLVKSARGQLGTLSHAKGTYLPFLSGIAQKVERVRAFLARPANAALVASALMAALSLANLLRGWRKALRMRKRRKARAWALR